MEKYIPRELQIEVLSYLSPCRECGLYCTLMDTTKCKFCQKIWCQNCSTIQSAPRKQYLEISLPICADCRFTLNNSFIGSY